MEFSLVKMALDNKAASICDEQSRSESDAVKKAIWQELADGYQLGTGCGRESVRWVINWAEETWSNRTNAEDLRTQAAYIRRLYP